MSFIQSDKFEFYLSRMKNALIRLSPLEKEIVRLWAQALQDADKNVPEQKIDPNRSSFEISYEGCGGEMAYAKQFRIYPNIITRFGNAFDYDHYGYLIDVKTNHRNDGDLIVRPEKNVDAKRCDYYALMVGTVETGFRYAGFASASTVFQESNLRDLKYGPQHVVPQKDLR